MMAQSSARITRARNGPHYASLRSATVGLTDFDQCEPCPGTEAVHQGPRSHRRPGSARGLLITNHVIERAKPTDGPDTSPRLDMKTVLAESYGVTTFCCEFCAQESNLGSNHLAALLKVFACLLDFAVQSMFAPESHQLRPSAARRTKAAKSWGCCPGLGPLRGKTRPHSGADDGCDSSKRSTPGLSHAGL